MDKERKQKMDHIVTHTLMKCQIKGCRPHYMSLKLITCPTGSLADSLDWVTASSSAQRKLNPTAPDTHIQSRSWRTQEGLHLLYLYKNSLHTQPMVTSYLQVNKRQFSKTFMRQGQKGRGKFQLSSLIHFITDYFRRKQTFFSTLTWFINNLFLRF